ncbi:MAG: efflux RND transporter periplasmic adaptor subunit [Armatimonadetes bacterium]|nr:efflux RND transporter periplasmic adaptor subunit [Armatimonadota bacterium]
MTGRWMPFAGLILLAGCGGGTVANQAADTAKVKRDTLEIKVVETGALDAVKSVEVKSRVSGRLAKLLVDEGDTVKAGQLIAIIDPREIQLQVDQQAAQFRGAQSLVSRIGIEIEQRRITARESLRQAEARLAQVKSELGAQPTLTTSAIASAKASYNSAQEELQRLKTSGIPNERTADEAALSQAEVNYTNAQSEYQRQTNLLKEGFTAQKNVEDAQLNVQVMRSRLEQAKQNHDRIEKQIASELNRAEQDVLRTKSDYDRAVAMSYQDGSKRQDYLNAIAEVEKARVALKDVDAMAAGKAQNQATADQLSSALSDARRNLNETEIRAPIDGIVTKKEIQEGELVASLSGFNAGTPIVRIEDRRSLRVIPNINEIDTAKLAVGMAADISVEALPDRKFTGHVKKVAPAGNNVGASTGAPTGDSVVRYSVEIWLDQADPALRSGMTAKCTLNVLKKDNVLVLPVEYVGTDEKGSYVLVHQQPGKDKKKVPGVRTNVKIGAKSGAFVEIVSGVNEGVEVDKPEYTGPSRSGFMQAGGGD